MAKPLKETPSLDCCDFSVITLPFTSVSEVLGYFDSIRTYIQHEDDLINTRLTWSLTIHGFLLAIYGLLLQKIAELYVELHKVPPPPSLPLHHLISCLLFLALPIATLGVFVAHQSRRAIVASHNAIQHLYSIAQSGGVLNCAAPPVSTIPAVNAGPATVVPSALSGIAAGTRLFVDGGSEAGREIVDVTAVAGAAFSATFSKAHSSGTPVRPLGWALLPKVIGGGDQGAHTGGARSYYLNLPLSAMGLWIVLLLISLILLAASIKYRAF
ncbi:MAG TPA: hypothetical protein VGD59_15740 [Acidisarcina sp.]